MNLLDVRRRAPRITVAGFCGVAVNNNLHHASMTNLSTLGLRLEGPYRHDDNATRVIQLEIELPGVDEIVWTSAEVTRAVLTPRGFDADGKPRFWCRAGLTIRDTSRSERRLLQDYIVESLRARAMVPDRRVAR